LHPSLEAAGLALASRGLQVDVLEVDNRGRISLEALRVELAKGDVKLVGFSLANHETGVLEDAAAIVELSSASGALTYADAVQAWGRVALDITTMGLDGVSISAHKIGGPKGVGALWLRPGPDVRPLIGGGKQENGLRPGTQACALIAGFAEACRQLPERLASAGRLSALRAQTEESLESMGAVLMSGEGGLCNTICARFEGVAGDLVVSGLDLQGVAISTGAACSSGSTSASKNLLGMGLNEQQALEAIRISTGPQTQGEELKVLLEKLPAIIERARQFS
jgi:cysteine desulfurase